MPPSLQLEAFFHIVLIIDRSIQLCSSSRIFRQRRRLGLELFWGNQVLKYFFAKASLRQRANMAGNVVKFWNLP